MGWPDKPHQESSIKRDSLNYDVREFVRNVIWIRGCILTGGASWQEPSNCDEKQQNNLNRRGFPFKAIYIKKFWLTTKSWTRDWRTKNRTEVHFIYHLVLILLTSNLTSAEMRGQNWSKRLISLGKLVFVKAERFNFNTTRRHISVKDTDRYGEITSLFYETFERRGREASIYCERERR